MRSKTYPQRKELFERQIETIQAELKRLNKVLKLLRYKCWYYEQAIKDGNEQRLKELRPEDVPEEI